MILDPLLRFLGWKPRIGIVALHDIFMSALSFQISLAIAYNLYGSDTPFFYQWPATLLFTAVAAVVFHYGGLYRGIWHYASFRDLVAIAKSVSAALLIYLPLLFITTRLSNFPRSALLIEWVLLIVFLSGPRLLYRAWKDGNVRLAFDRNTSERIPVLLVGAGLAAETFIRDIARRKTAGYRVVGLIDDKNTRLGRDIHGIRIMGTLDDVSAVIDKLTRAGQRPQRLIISADRIEGDAVAALLDLADRHGMKLSRLPRLTDFRSDQGNAAEIRTIDVEDLLGRPQKVLDREAMQRLIAGRRVLVTGAGGTIGSELVRQIADLAPAAITLFDNGEFNLYQIDMELAETRPQIAREAVLGDVRDRERLESVFDRAKPDLVFHAAAFKHVPLVEANAEEAVLTNVEGTRNIANACRAHGTGTMVLISTDKAVNPTNVMGATKRIAEMIAQALSVSLATRQAGTRYVTVRFGNVLGSTGSVVPLFQRQLKAGGPLTVTHPDVTRYFMTTREAVELILQAAALPTKEGKIFVLDMGKPVRIQDLARQMIRLAGFRPDVDVHVEFTGLRPGEKLYEELLHESEQLVTTEQDGIFLAAPRLVDERELYAALDQLRSAATQRDSETTRALINRLVPEFRSPESAGGESGQNQPRVASGD